MSLRAGAPFLLALAAALGCDDVVPIGGGFERLIDVPARPVRAVDVLFVIDDSHSMLAEQDALAADLGRFVELLDQGPGGPLDLHIGVISSDLGTAPADVESCEGDGDGGRLLVPPEERGCPRIDGRFLVDVAGPAGQPRITNYPAGQLGETLSCMARLGAGGCGFEQPLAAARRALDGSNPENAGFLRDDALLAVFFVTDEDDCSARDRGLFDPSQDDRSAPLGELSSFRCFEFGVECSGGGDPRALGSRSRCRAAEDSRFLIPIDGFAEFLVDRKRSAALVLVGGLFGEAEPVAVEEVDGRLALADVCPAEGFAASPAVRLRALAASLPSPSAAVSLCEPIARTAPALAAATAGALQATHCLRRQPLDGDPDEAGLQPACRAYRIADRARREMPLCASGAAPCFAIEPDPDACAFTPSHLGFRVEGELTAAPDARLQLECLAEPLPPPGVPVDRLDPGGLDRSTLPSSPRASLWP